MQVDSFYGYVPDRGISILFLVLFSVSTRMSSTHVQHAPISLARSNTHRPSGLLSGMVVISYCSPVRPPRNSRVERTAMVKFQPWAPRSLRDAVGLLPVQSD